MVCPSPSGFSGLWIDSLASNVGNWTRNVTAAWLMTDLSASALMIALVQAATSLPVCILDVPSGALADIVDRRRLLLVAQGWMLRSDGSRSLTKANRYPWLGVVSREIERGHCSILPQNRQDGVCT
jgi:MFS family permease